MSPAVPPCFTAMPCTLRDTNISPATDACPRVAEYLAEAVPCALSGPFGSLRFDPVLSTPDSLCVHNCFDLRFNGLKYKLDGRILLQREENVNPYF